MAVIYRALDIRLDRHVALKVLAPGLALDDVFRQRFIRESRAAAAVDHPHIVPIFEAGEADGILFIAMRYVPGGDVRKLLDAGGPLTAARADDIITQVASALDAAHLHGLVHRDVKPSNMLLDSTAGRGHRVHIYLADFGLSKRPLSMTGLTSIGTFLGTPSYMAPEQIEGRPVDGQADLYALACTSFEMLCGTPPFARDADMAIIWAHVSEPPPSLSARHADLPAAVDGVIAKALAKSPADRFPTCFAFAATLREALGLQADDPASVVDANELSAVAEPLVGRPADKAGSEPPEPPVHPVTEISLPHAGQQTATGADTAVPDEGAPDRPASAAEEPSETTRAERPAGATPVIPAAETIAAFTTRRPDAPSSGLAGRPPSASGSSARPQTPPAVLGRHRRWWRSRPAIVAAACVVVIGIAGGAFGILYGGTNSRGPDNQGTHGGTKPVLLSVPGCSTAVAPAAALPGVRTVTAATGGQPFGVVITADGKFSFVTLGNSIAVLSDGSALAPKVVHVFSAPGAQRGEALMHDGRFLIVAANSGAIVINAAAAAQGSKNPVVGALTSSFGDEAAEVVISPDDKFAFVTLQGGAGMAVFNLQRALSKGFGPADIVGKVSLGQQPVGMALSPDHRWLYVTAMTRAKTQNAAEGTISVVDLQRAEVKPASAVVSTATAGCNPVRVVISADGSQVWVTSRESDKLLAFSADALRTDPTHALIAKVDVGAAPIALAMIRGGRRILVADTNLHSEHGATSNVAVISTSAALGGGHAVLGVFSTGLGREFALQPNGKAVLLTDNNAGRLQAIDVSSLP